MLHGFAISVSNTGRRQAWQRRQGFYRYLKVAALTSSLILTPPDDEKVLDFSSLGKRQKVSKHMPVGRRRYVFRYFFYLYYLLDEALL